MSQFQLTTQTPRPLAYLERACGSNDASAAVRAGFTALDASCARSTRRTAPRV